MKIMQGMIFIAILLLMGSIIVSALPEGPNQLDVKNSTRRTVNGHNETLALAGNVTQLNITGSAISQSWTGFYGNVTGTLSLESSNGKRMYTWAIANPKGEIYATEAETTPTWGAPGQGSYINCWNYSTDRCGQVPCYSHAEIEGWDDDLDGASMTNVISTKGMKKNAVDSINNTFLTLPGRSFPSFYVGTRYINGTLNNDMCPSISLYNSTSEVNYGGSGILEPTLEKGSVEGGYYQEVILEDNNTNATIYTAIIDFERSMPGFDGNVWDFQMIVPEKGSSGDTATTTYNFYVELE